MSEYIVISRDRLEDMLIDAHEAGRTKLPKWSTKPAWEEPTGWRPIAEAPKNGTWVLVGAVIETVFHVETCKYTNSKWFDDSGYIFDMGSGTTPTHFLPLIQPT